jgi:predicted phosphodiesterase
MKKRKIIILAIIPVLLLALAGFFVFKSKIVHKADSAEKITSSAASPSPARNLHSFKGVISLIVETITGNSANTAQTSKKESQAPAKSAASDSYSFAIIGDTKLFEESPSSGNLPKAVDSIAKQNPDMVFAIGDLIFKCSNVPECEKSFSGWKGVMSPLIGKTYEVVGNHDRSEGSFDDSIWQKEFNLPANGPSGFTKQVYSFDFQNSHFAVLDTEKPRGGAVSDEQLAWLDQDLAAHGNQHIFVLFHEPAFPTSQFKKKSLDADPKQRDKLWKILVERHVTAVINGHEHFFTRKKIGNIYQFIVGNTDAPENARPKPGLSDYSYVGNIYAIVTVSGTKMNMSLYTVDGSLVNSFDF